MPLLPRRKDKDTVTVDDEKKETFRGIRIAGMVTVVPMMMAAGPIVGYFIGKSLDNWLGFEPWLMVSFALLGLVAGMVQSIKIIKLVAKDQNES